MRYQIPLPVLAAGMLLACGGENGQTTARGNCPPLGDAAVAAATEHYVRNVEPRPHRFLVMVGTDSTLPEAARRVLQDRGPTYLYPADGGQQATLRQRLAEVGSWTTLLVVLRDVAESGNRAEVELGGHFIEGAEGSEPALTMRVPLACEEREWRVNAGETPERVS